MAVGLPMKTTYANGDVFSASDVNDITGTINLLGYSPPVVAGKNGVINGGFQIWQRGTTSSGGAYLADRWYSALISGTGTFAQESTIVPSGSIYSQKFTVTALAQPALYQAIETQNAIRFAGQSVTVSAKVAASTSVGFTADVQYSTSVDNSVTGTWTSITATSGGTATATSTTFVSISGVYAIPSTAKSLRVRLFTTSTIAISVVVYFGQVQIEQGTSASAFSNAMGTLAGELAACQRYYERLINNGQNFSLPGFNNSSTQAYFTWAYKTTKRINPTITLAPAASDFGVRIPGGSNAALTAYSIIGNTLDNAWIAGTASGLTSGNGIFLIGIGANGFLEASSEL